MYLGGPASHVHEAATFLACGASGEPEPRYRLLLGALPDGRWHVYLMELPWGGHETERVFDAAPEACAAVDALYGIGEGDSEGVWRVSRSAGWDRP